jgi:archaellum component FlaF (FlaF/FlaG flagellin family)
VNANTDTVDCQRNWKNFNIDASPTTLESPSGNFSVTVTDSGITLGGGGATIVLQKDGQIKLNSVSDVTVKAAGNINLQAARVNQP